MKIFEFSFSKGFTFYAQNMGSFYYLLVPVVTALLQYVQATKSLAIQPAPAATSPEQKPSSVGGDFQSAMNTQMKYFFPLMIGFFSYQLPVGLSLYWNIFSIFSIIQSAGKTNTPKKKELTK